MTFLANQITKSKRSLCSLCLCGSILLPAAFARAEDSAAKKVTYQDDILPVMRNACLNCHNPDKKKAGLDLSNYSAAMTGSDNGKVVKPGDPQGSLLFRTITHAEEPYMPQKADKLPDKEISLFKDWIAGGAPETSSSKVTVAAKKNDLSTVVAKVGRPEGPPPMPQARLSLEPVVFTARPGALLAMAASPWAPLVALGGQHQICLYNTNTLDLIGILPFAAGQPNVLRFSKNGSLLIAAGGQAAKSGKVLLFDVKTGKKVAEVGDEFDAVLACDMTPDQAMIAVGGPNKVLRAYNTADGKALWAVKKHTDWVTAVAYSPDGVLLASGDRAGNLYVFEGKTGRDFYTLAGHKDAITDIQFRDDGNILASASQDGTVKLWNMHDGSQITNIGAHGNGVTSLAFAHDGTLVTTGRDSLTKSWKSDGGAIRSFGNLNDQALHVAITDDAKRVIAGDYTGTIRVWDTADGNKLGELTANPAGPAQRLDAAQKLVSDLQGESDKLTTDANAASALASKSAESLAHAQQGKGAKEVQDGMAKLADARGKLNSAKQTYEQARNDLVNKQNDAKRFDQEKIQTTIALENAQKGQRNGTRQRLAQIEQQIKQTADAIAALEKPIKAREEAFNKANENFKSAESEMNKALADADSDAKEIPQRTDNLRAATDAMAKAKVNADVASSKLAAAKEDLGRLKASIAGNAPATQPSARRD
jgi:WD40 repeat protein